MKKNITPVFLFSLPRSGSTLLQRVLMSHIDIASIAEPWILLPFIYSYKTGGVLSEYGHRTSSSTISEFINNLPNKEKDYHELLGEFISSLYEKQCFNNEKYFLDKTPRYYNIIPEIVKVFPDAKFIFLFRNPVHVMSSMLDTWSEGNLRRLYAYDRDLNYGFKSLSSNYEKMKQKSYALRYEDFVKDPETITNDVCDYLNIPFDHKMLSNFSSQDLKGKEGDPTGGNLYKSINIKPMDKWKNIFNTKFRKKVVINYINSIDEQIFQIQGYNKIDILTDVNNLKVGHAGFFSDRLDYLFSKLVQFFKLNIWFLKHTSVWANNKYLS